MTNLITERRVVVGGVATRILEVPGDGPVLLLLHGFTDSADTWRPVLSRLAEAGRRAVAVDLPGHGWAPPMQQPLFETLDRFVADFVVQYAAGEQVVLVGNSLGGLLTFRAARDERLPLAAVAGLGPAGLAHTHRMQLLAQWARIFHPLLGLIDRLPVPRSAVRRAALRVHHRLTEGTGRELAPHYAAHVASLRDVARLRGDLVALDKAVRADVLAPADIRVPVLMVWGLRDRLVDIKGAPSLLDVVPQSRLVVLDCGHLPQVQVPDEVTPLLLQLPVLGSAASVEWAP
jgi:pimeloyl-ACP methyl ester carboxylesterase